MKIIGHISDLHLDTGGRALERAQRVVRFLETLAPPLDALVVTGDIADHGLPVEYAQARSLLAGRGRVLACPGNHDARRPFREVLLGEAPSDDPINGVYDLGGLVIAMCDSTVPGRADGFLDDDTLAWLDEVLAATPTGLRAWWHSIIRPRYCTVRSSTRSASAARIASPTYSIGTRR